MGSRRCGWPLVLLYHAVVERPRGGLQIAPDLLRRQLLCILSRGLRPVTVSEALERGDGCVAVTFDDASASICEAALPLLSELGVLATAFVPTPVNGVGLLSREDLRS